MLHDFGLKCLMSVPVLPLELYRCLRCQQEGLAATADRLYCPQCGQIYPRLNPQTVDFIAPFGDPLPMTPAQAIAHLPIFAWGYEHLWRPRALSVLTGEPFDQEREALLLQALVGDAQPILDLATAGGYWSRLLLRQQPHRRLIGLDNASGVLAEASRQTQPEWDHYTLIHAQAERIPLATASLGAVISGASLNELPLQPCLEEIARVLRPGGVLVSMHSQHLAEGWNHLVQQALQTTGLRFYGEDELRTALAAVGLSMQRYLSYGAVAFVQAVR
ncbi:MAG: class I SAM-dependent methyltransferase [Cyanobacteriota bacterium]|nr:class I SAM-dependent methyltransferase [Cyanobacteriota bacterium]